MDESETPGLQFPPPSNPFLNPSFPTQTELLPSKFVLFVFIFYWKKKEKSTSITDMLWLETQNRNELGLWII